MNFNKIGEDVLVHTFVSIRPALTELGNHIAIDPFFHCTTKLVIKDYVHIGSHVSIIGGEKGYCEIGTFSGIAAGCRIICGSDEYLGEGIINPLVPQKYRDNVILKSVILKEFVTLATNVIVLPGVTLNQGVVVAAGSIVTKETEPWCIYAGNPARPISKRRKDLMIKHAKEMGYEFD